MMVVFDPSNERRRKTIHRFFAVPLGDRYLRSSPKKEIAAKWR